MTRTHDEEGLKKLSVSTEIALRRARKMVEFMRAVCENERRILKGSVQNSKSRRKEAAMSGTRFRIATPVVALSRLDRKNEILKITPGEIVTVKNVSQDGAQTMEVDWNGRTVVMYTRDLKERAEQID